MKFKQFSFFRKELVLLLGIVLVGSYLRFFGVFTNSFAFTYDVGRDMLALWNIVYLHKIPLIGATTGLTGVFYGPWWYYFLTPFFFISSGDPQGVAFLMAAIGILSIIFGYFLGKRVSGKGLGLFIALIMSTSPYMISLSAQIWNPNIAPLFVIFVLLLLLKLFKKDKKRRARDFLLLGFLLGFNIDLEIVFGLLFSIAIILSLIFILKKKITIKNILFLALGYLIVFAPRILFDLRHQFLMTKSFFKFFTQGGSQETGGSIVNLVVARSLIIFDQFSQTIAANNKLLALLIVVFITYALKTGYKKAETNIKNFINVSLIVLIVFVLGTVFFSHDIWPHYLVGLPVFYILLFSLSLEVLAKKFKSYLPFMVIAIFLFIINLNPVSVFANFQKPLWIGDASVYRNQLEVIDHIYSEAKGEDFKYVVYTPPVHDYTYQYLFLWYGPKKYKYAPVEKSNLAFFILEPDLEHPERLANWLNNRKEDGKIVKTEKLKSGIVIQTRKN